METVIISMHLYHSKEDYIHMMISESIIHQELVLKNYQSRKYQRTITQITVSMC